MMRIPNNFYIKCNECGNVTLVEADDLDYETSVYDRPMGEEIEYDFRGEICCDKCHSWIDFCIRGYEYPVGAFNFSDSECHGGCFIDEPVVEMDYEFDFDYYDDHWNSDHHRAFRSQRCKEAERSRLFTCKRVQYQKARGICKTQRRTTHSQRRKRTGTG